MRTSRKISPALSNRKTVLLLRMEIAAAVHRCRVSSRRMMRMLQCHKKSCSRLQETLSLFSRWSNRYPKAPARRRCPAKCSKPSTTWSRANGTFHAKACTQSQKVDLSCHASIRRPQGHVTWMASRRGSRQRYRQWLASRPPKKKSNRVLDQRISPSLTNWARLRNSRGIWKST